jgi:hypothetical protein
MRTHSNHKIWATALLLLIFAAGCGDADKNAGGGGVITPTTPPTVILVTPPAGSVGVCPNTAIITATFSKAMNPATINTSTFTLTGPGGTSVAGTVTYAAANNIATFTPSSGLALNTVYTATITTGVADTFGNMLAANFSWSFTTPVNPCPPSPIVTLVTPANGNAGVCASTAIITATFSHAMDPATINTSTFTLTGPGGSVAGAVTYVAANNVATFSPTSTLTANTVYTATITTGVADTFGQHLLANFVWSFTTAPTCPPPPPPVPTGTTCSVGILAGTTVTNVAGTATHVTGDVDVWPGTAITGFGAPASITGSFNTGPGPGPAMTAQGDLTTAYNSAGTAAGGTFGLGTGTGTVLPADIGGLPNAFPPGVYRTTSAQPSLGITGNLVLDGGGNPNAVWIFQIGSTLTTAAGNSHIILQGNANAHNVFWQVGSSATLGTNTIFQGTIMAQTSITLTTGATLNGRALARAGAVTLDTNIVNVPPCP